MNHVSCARKAHLSDHWLQAEQLNLCPSKVYCHTYTHNGETTFCQQVMLRGEASDIHALHHLTLPKMHG